jgi:hypothetical protein
MEEIINGLRQIKTRVDSGTITTVNGTETLLSKQLASMLEKAINYTRCCEELKDKKAMTFEEWVESEGYTEKWDGYFKNGIKSTYWIVKGKYVMYTNELNLLLLTT